MRSKALTTGNGEGFFTAITDVKLLAHRAELTGV
jgi:hypothetical protein